MKPVLHLWFAAVLCSFTIPVHAQFIELSISYKVILNPETGRRPAGVTDAALDQAIARMNQLMEGYWRGYRFFNAGVREVGARNDTTGPGKWYDTNFFDEANGARWKEEMEMAAKGDKTTYGWIDDKINIYITTGICGGICSFLSDDIIIVGACSASDGEVQLHEIGHYYNLYHTQGFQCGCVDPTKSGACHTSPGDDAIADTLPDLSNWNRDGIARWNFNNRNYSQLNEVEREQVNDAFLNVMSYHGASCGQGAMTVRLTEQQLDRWTDACNTVVRNNSASGHTIFVDHNGNPNNQGGGSSSPFVTLATGINATAPRNTYPDIVLLRPGAYGETLTISKRVILRATRNGSARIGSAAAPSPPPTPLLTRLQAASVESPLPSREDRRTARLGFAGSGANP